MNKARLKQIEEVALNQDTIDLINEVKRLKKEIFLLKKTNKELENNFEIVRAANSYNEWLT